MRLIRAGTWGQNFIASSRRRTRYAFYLATGPRAGAEVDAIIVAGDFESGSPSYARTVYHRFAASADRRLFAWWCWRATTTRWRCANEIPAIAAYTVVANAGICAIEQCRRHARHILSSAFLRLAQAGDQPGRSSGHWKTAAAAGRHQRLLSGAVSPAGLWHCARRSAPIIASR